MLHGYCFETVPVSGLEVNLGTSSNLGINLNGEEVKEFAGIMGCSIQN